MQAGLVIIGTGLAGYNLAREFRKLDKATPLTMLTGDDGSFYSKPMLSNALSKGKQADELVTSTAEKMAADLDATIRCQTEVTKIDAPAHRISLADGESIDYERLVLAMGGRQLHLPLQGDAVADILYVNSLEDYRRFRVAIANKKRIAILGPGLIGCEFANDLVSAGYEVHVIGPDKHPLGHLLPPEAGALVQHALSDLGVRWHLQTIAQSITRAGGGVQLNLSDGSAINTDVVLSAAGLRPNLAVAAMAGLKVDRGIIVNRLLETSAKDIYALGDCAEVEGKVLPYVLPLMAATRALARTLCGEPTPLSYPAMPVVIKTPAHPVVVSPPDKAANGRWMIESDQSGVRALFHDEDKLLGFVLTGVYVSDRQALSKELPPLLP